jgi:hypothetical protein
MVDVSESTKKYLYESMLKLEHRDTISSGLLIHSLISDEKENSYKLVTGVYSVRFMGPHFVPYLFIYSKGKSKMLKDYSVESLLKELNAFFLENKQLTFERKVKYLEKNVEIMKERN